MLCPPVPALPAGGQQAGPAPMLGVRCHLGILKACRFGPTCGITRAKAAPGIAVLRPYETISLRTRDTILQ